MKALVVILICVIGALLLIYISTPSGHKQEIKTLKDEVEQIKRSRDSTFKALKLVKDSLKIAELELSNAHKETQKATELAEKQRKYYEKIIFVSFANDSIRRRELSILYPSYSYPR